MKLTRRDIAKYTHKLTDRMSKAGVDSDDLALIDSAVSFFLAQIEEWHKEKE